MRKLLFANFSRLWKEKIFWLAFAFMSIGSATFSWMSYSTAMKDTGIQFFVEDMMFNMLPMMGFVISIVISMRLGTEFKSGLIENGFLLLCCILMASLFSAMIVGICMNVHNKAVSVVVSVIFLLAILLLASFCINALEEPPTTYSYVNITMDGVQFGEVIDNSAYVDGIQRTIYELIADMLPTGQTIQLNNLEYARAARWPLLSVIMLAIATIAGYMPFRKRDIQ